MNLYQLDTQSCDAFVCIYLQDYHTFFLSMRLHKILRQAQGEYYFTHEHDF